MPETTSMGPRPGCGVLRVWQGIVETSLRVATIVFALATSASAALVIYNIADTEGLGGDLVRKTKGVEIGFASVSAAAVVFQLLMIVLRFLNIGFVNKYIGIVLIVNIVLCFLLGLGYLGGGAAAAKFAHDWSPFADVPGLPGSIATIRKATAASSALGFASMILFMTLTVWLVLFLIKRWNRAITNVNPNIPYTVQRDDI